MRPVLLSIALIAILCPPSALAATPYLVKDINQATVAQGSNPSDFVRLGSLALFTTHNDSFAAEGLRRTDGTNAGTFRLTNPPTGLVVWNNKAWFLLDGVLWSTDGSVAGTQQVPLPVTSPALAPTKLLPGATHLYFLSGGMLWRTDGTAAGTTQLTTVAMGPIGAYAVAGSVFYFVSGDQLWKIDGNGIFSQIKEFNGRSSGPIVTVGNVIYLATFTSRDDRWQVWRSDGTATGTFALKAAQQLLMKSWTMLVTSGSLVYFVGDDGSGAKLWRTNGTNAGTVAAAASLPGATPDFEAMPLIVLPNGTILFVGAGQPSSTGTGAIWAYDGTNLTFLSNVSSLNVQMPIAAAGNVAVFGNDRELWRSDGTIGGTYGLQRYFNGFFWPMISLGPKVVFGRSGDVHGNELWQTDGSAANTTLVKDIVSATADSRPSDLTPFRNGILFTATTEHQDLWFSDGTEAGTKKLLDLHDGNPIVACGGRAFFTHTSPETGIRLWMTDGTPEGTTRVDASPAGVSPGITCIDGTVLFSGGWNTSEPALWPSDGTAAGTLPVTSAADESVPASFDPLQPPVPFGHRVYFATADQGQASLWRSDGTRTGTVLVKDFPDTLQITQLKAAGNFLYFITGASVPNQYTLWRSDGTTDGTVAMRDSGWISLMADFYGRLTYSLTDAICTTDGASNGTCFQPAAATPGNAFQAVPMNGRLYYGRGDLRSTDGTAEIATGIERLEKLLTTGGGRLYAFARENFSTNMQLLETDGTLAGSRTFPVSITYLSTAVASGGRIFVGAEELYALDSDVTATSFSPGIVTVPGGATVTISGRGFTGPVTVRVDSVLATPRTVTPTSITFTAPTLEAGFHNIDLTLGDGSRMILAEPLRYVCSGPTAVITDPPGAVCPLTPVQLHGSGGTRCDWFPSTGLDDPSSCNPTATVATTTAYTLIASTEAGCSSTNHPAVTVEILPIGSAIILGAQPEPNQPSTAFVPDAGPGATYAWTIEGGTIDSGAATRTITYRTSCAAATRLHVTVVVGGCPNTGTRFIAILEPILDSARPDPANPGSLVTVSGRHLSCIDELQLRTDDGSWMRPVPFTIVNNSALQFRNPPDTPRFVRASASTPALPYFVSTPLYRRSSRHDFNGDVRADIFWHNAATGQTSIWRMNYNTFTGLVAPSAPPPWVPVAFGDFNDDAMADILWMHPTTGETSIWLMNGTVAMTAVRSTRVPAAWKPAGSGDFDGDGRADIFWHNPTTGETSIWFMNGTAIVAVRAITVPSTWKPLAFGDFNADGKGDIFWRNPVSGETSIWLMNGATPSITVRSETVAAAWQVAGSGDFNADHKDDLLWFNPTTGETRFWYMDGIAISAKVSMPTMPAGWAPAQVGHYYQDDRADVFWYNATTGDTQVWMLLVSPTAPFQTFPLLRVTNPGWKPVSAL